MKIDILFSSSEGNACRIYNDQYSILVDCGVAKKRLFENGHFPVDTLFISHSHSDHTRGAGIIGRATDCQIVLEEVTYKSLVKNNPNFFNNCKISFCSSGTSINNGIFTVSFWKTSHDGKGGLFYTILENATDQKFGILTDTGIITDTMKRELPCCQGLLLESNHDIHKLMSFPDYPAYLKERIRGDKGHLSNLQALVFTRDNLELNKLKWLALGHLSPRTNTSEIVLNEFQTTFPEYKHFYVAPTCLEL